MVPLSSSAFPCSWLHTPRLTAPRDSSKATLTACHTQRPQTSTPSRIHSSSSSPHPRHRQETRHILPFEAGIVKSTRAHQGSVQGTVTAYIYLRPGARPISGPQGSPDASPSGALATLFPIQLPFLVLPQSHQLSLNTFKITIISASLRLAFRGAGRSTRIHPQPSKQSRSLLSIRPVPCLPRRRSTATALLKTTAVLHHQATRASCLPIIPSICGSRPKPFWTLLSQSGAT